MKWTGAGRSSLVAALALALILIVAGTVRELAGYVTLSDPSCPSDSPVMAFNVGGNEGQDDIAVLGRGGEVRRLTDDAASWDPRFSPNGRQIVYVNGRGSYSDSLGFERHAVYVMTSDGSGRRPLMEAPPPSLGSGGSPFDESPAWSPEGDTIAFVRDNDQLMLVGAGGGEPRLLLASDVPIASVAWSPTSDRIAFTPAAESAGGVFVLDVDTKQVTRVARKLETGGDLAWSPTGGVIAVESFPDLYLVPLAASRAELFVRDAEAPAWSSSGDDVAYFVDAGDGSGAQLFTKPQDGGDGRRVDTGAFPLDSFDGHLDWLGCGTSGS